MRVHQIISDYSMFTGGAQRVVRTLHAGLRSRNIETYILGVLKQKDDAIAGARSLGLESQYGWNAFHGVQQYLLKDVKPNDIVHVHLFPPILYVSLLRMIAQFPCHFVCTEHSTFNHRRGTFLGNILDTMIYPGYEQVIAISEGVEQELLKSRPGLKGKTRVIHNGVPMSFQNVLRRRPKERLKVLSIGNLRPAKNYDNAIRAVALLGGLDFEYLIAGTGECMGSLLQLSEQLGIRSKVQFLGYVETVPELLASVDIFLMPSKWEGFGLAAVEAMNAGLPLVASNVPGLQEIVRGASACAVLIDPDSPEAIAEGLKQLLNFPELRLQLGENAFHNAQKFNNDRMVEKHLSLYAELIDPCKNKPQC